MMSCSFEIFLFFFFFQSIDYWLIVIQKINGCIQGAFDSANKWMHIVPFEVTPEHR